MSKEPPILDVLVVAPHPDDAELGMGAQLQNYCNQGDG